MTSNISASKDSAFDDGAALLAALGSRTRLVILRMLIKGEMSVSTLSLLTGISKSSLSQHLARLHAEKLVVRRRCGNAMHYSCHSTDVIKMLRALDDIWPGSPIKRKSSGR